MTEFGSLNHSPGKRVLNCSNTIYLRFWKVVEWRVIVIKFRMNNKCGKKKRLIFSLSVCLSVCVNVHCIHCYTPYQTFHYSSFFNSRFILPVNNFFFSINIFFAISNSAQYLSSDIKLPKCLKWLKLVPLVVYQHKCSSYCFPFGLCTPPLSFFTLICAKLWWKSKRKVFCYNF